MSDLPATAVRPQPIRFTVTADDAVDATRAYSGHRSTSAIIVGALLVMAGAAAVMLTSDLMWLILVGIGAFGLASPFLRSFDRAMARANPQVRVGEDCTMQFLEQGLRFEQGAVSGLIDWSAADELRVGENAILILKNRAVVAAIPKRAFRSPAELEAAVTFLSAKVPTA